LNVDNTGLLTGYTSSIIIDAEGDTISPMVITYDSSVNTFMTVYQIAGPSFQFYLYWD